MGWCVVLEPRLKDRSPKAMCPGVTKGAGRKKNRWEIPRPTHKTVGRARSQRLLEVLIPTGKPAKKKRPHAKRGSQYAHARARGGILRRDPRASAKKWGFPEPDEFYTRAKKAERFRWLRGTETAPHRNRPSGAPVPGRPQGRVGNTMRMPGRFPEAFRRESAANYPRPARWRVPNTIGKNARFPALGALPASRPQTAPVWGLSFPPPRTVLISRRSGTARGFCEGSGRPGCHKLSTAQRLHGCPNESDSGYQGTNPLPALWSAQPTPTRRGWRKSAHLRNRAPSLTSVLRGQRGIERTKPARSPESPRARLLPKHRDHNSCITSRSPAKAGCKNKNPRGECGVRGNSAESIVPRCRGEK
jgi:hypothetical protein